MTVTTAEEPGRWHCPDCKAWVADTVLEHRCVPAQAIPYPVYVPQPVYIPQQWGYRCWCGYWVYPSMGHYCGWSGNITITSAINTTHATLGPTTTNWSAAA